MSRTSCVGGKGNKKGMMSLGEAHCSQTSLNGEVKAMLSAGLVFLLALHAARRPASAPAHQVVQNEC